MARRVLISAVLAALTVYVYKDVSRCGFVNFDDPVYVTENPRVTSGLSWDNFRWAMTSSYASNWFPLTWLSLMIDASVWGGDNAGGFHITNLALHTVSSLVLFFMLENITKAAWRSALVAALFAVHPLHVESVAWITERKDVLSTLFGLLSIWAYCRYAVRSCAGWYAASLSLFAASLMSKQMFVTLPILLLLLDYWPLERRKRTSSEADDANVPSARKLILEKVPFAILAGVASLVVVLVQQKGGTVQSLVQVPLGMRLSNAAISTILYLAQIAWPVNLAVFYPYSIVQSTSGPTVDVCLFCGVTSALLILGGTAVTMFIGRWQRSFLCGWLWYLVTLLPVIGIIQVGSQKMADRYTYVPSIGIFIAVAWLIPVPKRGGAAVKIAIATCAIAILAALSVQADNQVGYWQNSISLFDHAIEVTGPNATAQTNFGLALADAGRTDEAVTHLETALSIDPNHAIANNNLGVLLQKSKPETALAHFQKAAEIDANYATAHANLAGMLFERGEIAPAEDHYRRAQFLEPENPQFLLGLGRLLHATNRHDDAAFYLERACRIAPEHAPAHMELGTVLFELGRVDEGMEYLQQSVALDPESATAHQNLGAALFARGKIDEAIEQFQSALKLKPDFAEARKALDAAQKALSMKHE